MTMRTLSHYLRSIGIIAFLLSAASSFAGECLTSDEELYAEVVSLYEAAKKGEMGSRYGGEDLYCWRGDPDLTAKVRTILTNMLFDSRIHPAYVVTALNDYQSVFNSMIGNPEALLNEVQKKQGPSRYALIQAAGVLKGAPPLHSPNSKSTASFPENVDFIDGPANIRNAPKGSLVASLPDNTKVRILRKQGSWIEIEADGVRGWTSSMNLMSSHIGAVDADGFTVLSRAAFMGYFETVRFLLARGAQVGLVDGFGRNALHWAVRGGFAGLDERELEMVKLLSAVPGVNVNQIDKEGSTALLTAVSLGRMDMVTVLLGMKAIDVNLPDPEGMTPLMRALQYHRADIAAALLGVQGLNLNAADERGRTALYHAVALGDQKNVAVLLERKARTDRVTKEGTTLLHAAFEPKPGRLSSDPANIEIVKLLAARKDIDINKEDGKGMTPMILAIDHDQPEIVGLFLARADLDVNKRTAAGDYLNRAIRHSRLRHGHEIAMMLLDREEIDVNVPYYKGETLVHMGWYNAGMGTHGLELAKKILARRPDLNRENEYGETPLVYNINQNRPEMVRLLAETPGIELNRLVKDMKKTPLALARFRKYTGVVDVLKAAGAREFPLVGDEALTPEGIPQALLQNEWASETIIFMRSYLIETTEESLLAVREKRLDDAVRQQEAVLDVIVGEVADMITRYSAHQRDLAKKVLAEIKKHYSRHPREKSRWFKAVPESKKTYYATMDDSRDEIVAGKYDATPDGESSQNPSTEPVMIIRDYMAQNSIKALAMLKAGKDADAESFLKEVVSRSDPSGAATR